MKHLLRTAALAALLLGAAEARAYCIYNDLANREVTVAQDHHPDPLRQDRRFQATLKPGQGKCCRFHDLDCSPDGRKDAVVRLAVFIGGENGHWCGYPEGEEPFVKVTGGGTVRVTANPRKKSESPYIVRVRTHDGHNVTGPRGLACPAAKPKGKK